MQRVTSGMVLRWGGVACLVIGALGAGALAQVDPATGDPASGTRAAGNRIPTDGATGGATGGAFGGGGGDPGDGLSVPLTHERIVRLIEQLGSDDWATRQRAEQFLLLTPASELAYIEARLGDAAMSVEQRVRLWRVGSKVFRRLPRAAMGISFVSGRAEDVPMIREPIRGFDSFRVLRAGDVVTRLEGRAIQTVAQLRAAIIGFEPETPVTVEVERAGAVVAVSFRLGAYASLANQRLSDAEIEAAWRWRIERSGARVGGERVGGERAGGNGMGGEGGFQEPPPIVPPFEPSLPAGAGQAVAAGFSPTIYQFGAAVAVAAGQPMALPPASPYRPSAMNVGARPVGQDGFAGRGGRGGGQVGGRIELNANIDRIRAIETQIAENRRAIGLQEQRINAIDKNLAMPHNEADRKRLADLRAAAASEITRLTVDSARLSRFLETLRR